jgi:hypothetical protein
VVIKVVHQVDQVPVPVLLIKDQQVEHRLVEIMVVIEIQVKLMVVVFLVVAEEIKMLNLLKLKLQILLII